jgi:hypothetical protein
VQGRLRNKPLSVTIDTECAHCAKPLTLTIDSDLGFRAKEKGCAPIIFVPDVDLVGLKDESIVQAF